MVYGTGGVSSFLAGLFASSTSRLYSSRGSVTLPEAGTGGGATASSSAAKPRRTSIPAKASGTIFLICHLPSSRADQLVPRRAVAFRRPLLRRATREERTQRHTP